MDGHGIATFDLPASGSADDGDYVVYPDSLLFKAGEYEAQQYAMTPEEIEAAAADFAGPIPNELEHVNTRGTRTILDGHLGHVREIRAAEGGKELRGTVAIPKWLDAVWQAPAKKVSAVWDRATKRLKGLGLVIDGAVPEAALFSAYATFAAERTYEGSSTLQQLHDQAARAGAICTLENSRKPVTFNTSAEADAIQKVHDAAIKGGAKCRVMTGDDAARYPVPYFSVAGRKVTFATPRKRIEPATDLMQRVHDGLAKLDGKVCDPKTKAASFADYPKQLKALKAMHDMAVDHGATCPGGRVAMSAVPGPGRIRRMARSWFSKILGTVEGTASQDVELTEEEAAQAAADLKATFNADGTPKAPATGTPAPSQQPTGTASFADSPEGKALREEVDRLKREAKERTDREAATFARQVSKEADAFVHELARPQFNADGKIIPNSAKLTPDCLAEFAALYEVLAHHDARGGGTVTFSKAEKSVTMSAVDLLKAACKHLPGHNLIGQQFARDGVLTEGHSVVFNQAGGSSMDPEEAGRQAYEEYAQRQGRGATATSGNGNGRS